MLTFSNTDVHVAVNIVFGITEAVRKAQEIPEGTLYAALCGKISLDGFESALRSVVRTGLVERRGHVLRWAGPSLRSEAFLNMTGAIGRDPRKNPQSGDRLRLGVVTVRVDPCEINGQVFYQLRGKRCQIDIQGWIDWCAAMDAEVLPAKRESSSL